MLQSEGIHFDIYDMLLYVPELYVQADYFAPDDMHKQSEVVYLFVVKWQS